MVRNVEQAAKKWVQEKTEDADRLSQLFFMVKFR